MGNGSKTAMKKAKEGLNAPKEAKSQIKSVF